MNFKQVVPYVLAGSLFIGAPRQAKAQTAPQEQLFNEGELLADADTRQLTFKYFEKVLNNRFLEKKAQKLCDAYQSNMLRALNKLQPLVGKRGYYAAVRKELPGAPVGQHCMYGQHTQLSRALSEMGDTLNIIPQEARAKCTQFKACMAKKYKNRTEDCIYEGKLYESEEDFGRAIDKYLAARNIDNNTQDSVRNAALDAFAAKNFCADELNPGTILIVPRYRGSRRHFHAIMYLGRGKVENKKFIPTPDGRHIYTGHNRENIGDLFNTYDMSNVFAADIKHIAKYEYGQELLKIQSMTSQQLVEYLGLGPDAVKYSHDKLVQMSTSKYFEIGQANKNLSIRNIQQRNYQR